jgi:DNA-binding transcriptional ArsR family regulator
MIAMRRRRRRAIACYSNGNSLYFVIMRNSDITNHAAQLLKTAKAIASPVRLEVLRLLKDPITNFSPQVDGDLLKDGVCADFIREAVGIAAATASRHLTLLKEAGLLVATRKKGWTFYRRDERAILHFASKLRSEL